VVTSSASGRSSSPTVPSPTHDAIALCWAAFFGRPDLVAVLLAAGSEPSQRNKHGLTPLGCAVGGTEGRWRQFSDASLDDWRRAADMIRAHGGTE
jgi:Ankyrin repeats (many copies)